MIDIIIIACYYKINKQETTESRKLLRTFVDLMDPGAGKLTIRYGVHRDDEKVMVAGKNISRRIVTGGYRIRQHERLLRKGAEIEV